jgi:hypothetical protein
MLPSEHKFWKSKNLREQDQVRCEGASDRFFYFEVGEYQVKIAKKEEYKDNCTCQHGSIWGIGKECSHIKACKDCIKEGS